MHSVKSMQGQHNPQDTELVIDICGTIVISYIHL